MNARQIAVPDVRRVASIGWLHARPEPPAVFEERKAWAIGQCAALPHS
jgi:hypothetical protein